MEKTVIGIVGCGFVADYYLATKYAYPHLEIRGIFDIDTARLKTFCEFYSVHACTSLDELLNDPSVDLIINLTNPDAHYEVSKQCLLSGKHVYSEKPIAMAFEQAEELVALADEKGLQVSSAPCNALGRSAQTLKKAVNEKVVGEIRLVYAELEDGFVPIMPFKKWYSASGAAWPYRDEFEVGCTLEHSGYYLGWFVAIFGEIQSITAFSDYLLKNKIPGESPLTPDNTADMSIGIIKFSNGVVARLSTTIIAERDYSIRLFGDNGVIRVSDCWNNGDAVRYQRYINIRRKTLLNPLKKSMPPADVPVHKMEHSKTKMDFLLGVNDLAIAIQNKTEPFLSKQRSLHINEAALALQYAGNKQNTYIMKTKLTS